MQTEYARTICKSAERHRLRSGSGKRDREISEDEVQHQEAYGNLVPLPTRSNLPSAALSIPSF